VSGFLLEMPLAEISSGGIVREALSIGMKGVGINFKPRSVSPPHSQMSRRSQPRSHSILAHGKKQISHVLMLKKSDSLRSEVNFSASLDAMISCGMADLLRHSSNCRAAMKRRARKISRRATSL